jgi:Flp pilus assembly protein TadD
LFQMFQLRAQAGFLGAFLALCGIAAAQDTSLERAKSLYQRTEYAESLRVLAGDSTSGAEVSSLKGKNYFMLGDLRHAAEAFERAVAAAPMNAEYELWLGRVYGRKAETADWITAGFQASRARQCMEKAVALSPHYHEALNDLFAYYVEAPAFLGGGLDKAEAIALRIAEESPAEYHFAEAQIAQKRKDYPAAERHLRRAMELAPSEVGRVIDVAVFLARRGRMEESENMFAQAERLAANDPRVAFARAKVYVEHKRNLAEARQLLRKYLQASVTPDDPPKEAAERLLLALGS